MPSPRRRGTVARRALPPPRTASAPRRRCAGPRAAGLVGLTEVDGDQGQRDEHEQRGNEPRSESASRSRGGPSPRRTGASSTGSRAVRCRGTGTDQCSESPGSRDRARLAVSSAAAVALARLGRAMDDLELLQAAAGADRHAGQRRLGELNGICVSSRSRSARPVRRAPPRRGRCRGP